MYLHRQGKSLQALQNWEYRCCRQTQPASSHNPVTIHTRVRINSLWLHVSGYYIDRITIFWGGRQINVSSQHTKVRNTAFKGRGLHGCSGWRGSESVSYQRIRTVFGVASSEHAHRCLEVRGVDSGVDLCVFLVRCHLCGIRRAEWSTKKQLQHKRESLQTTGGNFGWGHVEEVTQERGWWMKKAKENDANLPKTF